MAKMTAKKALLTSILSLLVCITMLVGTTFAWFTDSVTSGTNKIIAGNLDVEFYHTNAAIANDPVEGETKLFKDVTLWEPGAYAYEKFTVANEGTLALKYALTIHHIFHNTVYYSGQNTGYSLLDALYVKEVEVIPSARPDYAKADGTPIADYVNAAAISGVLAAGQARDRIVVIYWPQDANDNNLNLQNGKYASDSAYAGDNTLDYATNKGALTIDFAVSLVATQNTVESDSFDDQYDKDAEYPVISIASTTITGPLDLTKVSVLEIKTPEQNTAIKYAEVPAQAANAVYEAIVAEAEATTAESNELTLSLNVEKTSETTTEQGTTVDLQIDMNAVLKTTKNSVTTTTEKAVTALQDYVTINYSLGAGLTDVAATHNGNGMEALISADAVPTNANGGYYYNSTTGILTIKTKSFSPFAVSYTVPVDSISLDKSDVVLNDLGETESLTVTVLPDNATDKNVVWTSSKTTVATVENGVITAVGAGTATITATLGGKSANCSVTVYDAEHTVFAPVAAQGDTVLVLGNYTVTVPEDAAKVDDTLILTINEITAVQATAAKTFNIIGSSDFSVYAYIDIIGISSGNTVPITVTVNVGEGVQKVDAYKGKFVPITGSNYGWNMNAGTLFFKNTTFENASISYGYNIRFTLSESVQVTDGSATATIAATAQSRVKDVNDLSLIITEVTPYSGINYDPQEQCAIAYTVNVQGLATGNVTFTIPTGNKVSADAVDFVLYRDNTNGTSISGFNGSFNTETREMIFTLYFTTMNPMPPYYITMLYTDPNQAEINFINTVKALGENEKTVYVVSPYTDDSTINLKNVCGVLTGKDDIILICTDNNVPATLYNTGAVFNGVDGLTVREAVVNSSGKLEFKGDGILLDHVTSVANAVSAYIKLTGANNTISYSTIDAYNQNVYGYSAVSLSGDGSVDSVTTIDHCNIIQKSIEEDAVRYLCQLNGKTTKEEIVALYVQKYGYTEEKAEQRLANQVAILGNGFRDYSGGVKATDGYYGKIIISDSTIKVYANAIYVNYMANPYPTDANRVYVKDSVIDSTSMTFNNVASGQNGAEGAKFENVTFKNTWDDNPLTITTETSSHPACYYFEDCEFETTFKVWKATKTDVIDHVVLKNCTFNGAAVTEDNIAEFISFNFQNTNADNQARRSWVFTTDGDGNSILTITLA